MKISAQNPARIFSGTVIDDSTGEALIGAVVMIPGTSCGAVTDFDGHFQLKVPAALKCDSLTVKYVAYHPLTMAVSGFQNGAALRLHEMDIELDDGWRIPPRFPGGPECPVRIIPVPPVNSRQAFFRRARLVLPI
jgi:hypothetical protein